MLSRFLPPAAVSLAAMLWGADGLWRNSLIQSGFPSGATVFWEHVILVAACGWLLWRDRRVLATLKTSDWIAVFLIGVGASAIATVLFTQAFSHASFTTVLLLQKTQPLFAISLAAVLLTEPLPPRFWPLLPLALLGAYLITFSDASPIVTLATAGDKWVGVLLTLGAAALWGAGTVFGRRLLAHVPYSTATALRFTAALPALAIITASTGFAVPGPAQVPPLLATALLSGLAGLLLYYWGLKQTPAAVATLCELWFPVTAIALGAATQGTAPSGHQIAGILLLWGSLALMRHRPVPATERTATPALATG